jgi:hypothetical protein
VKPVNPIRSDGSLRSDRTEGRLFRPRHTSREVEFRTQLAPGPPPVPLMSSRVAEDCDHLTSRSGHLRFSWANMTVFQTDLGCLPAGTARNRVSCSMLSRKARTPAQSSGGPARLSGAEISGGVSRLGFQRSLQHPSVQGVAMSVWKDRPRPGPGAPLTAAALPTPQFLSLIGGKVNAPMFEQPRKPTFPLRRDSDRSSDGVRSSRGRPVCGS